MKKLFFATSVVALCLAMSSCQSDGADSPAPVSNTFTAALEQVGGSRTALDGKSVAWVEGDEIVVNGVKYMTSESGTSASFEKNDTKAAPTGALKAYYPVSIYGNPTTLPATQTYEDGKISNCPMYASVASGNDLSFKNLCGVLEFVLTGSGTLSNIVVEASEPLAGSFTVSDNKAVIGSGGSNTVTLDCGEGVTLDAATPKYFHIAIPAGDSYTASGFKVTFNSTDGKSDYMKATKAFTIGRNTIYSFSRKLVFGSVFYEKVTSLSAGDYVIAVGSKAMYPQGKDMKPGDVSGIISGDKIVDPNATYICTITNRKVKFIVSGAGGKTEEKYLLVKNNKLETSAKASEALQWSYDSDSHKFFSDSYYLVTTVEKDGTTKFSVSTSESEACNVTLYKKVE